MEISLRRKNGKRDFLTVYGRRLSELGNGFGLMFSQREKAEVLIFGFSKPTRLAIHSFFVFFPFIALWLNDKKELLEFKIVKPWTFHVTPKQDFSTLIEIPMNKNNKELIKIIFSSTGERFK